MLALFDLIAALLASFSGNLMALIHGEDNNEK